MTGILETLRKKRLRGRGPYLAGLVAGIAAVVVVAALSIGPFDAPAESRDLCSGDAIVQPPPNIPLTTPGWDPSKGEVPTLPAGSVVLPPFDPGEPESRPALPDGWTWDGNEPLPVNLKAGGFSKQSVDGKLYFTLFPADAVISWDDPDRPEGLPWYDPTIEDPCR